MDTPNDRAGYLTEFTMSRIKTQCDARGTKQLEGGQYNRVYECVYEVLFLELSRLHALGAPEPPKPAKRKKVKR